MTVYVICLILVLMLFSSASPLIQRLFKNSQDIQKKEAIKRVGLRGAPSLSATMKELREKNIKTSLIRRRSSCYSKC
ncbi:hypothetical protein K501DRAFT_284670 [Backusella circina FSU 941]|nr:hypothetical protein K501DRAFT_284670 [Backusella circina FSU 941]